MANPEEANARIISQALLMRAGKIDLVTGQADYNHFAELAKKNFDDERIKRAQQI